MHLNFRYYIAVCITAFLVFKVAGSGLVNSPHGLKGVKELGFSQAQYDALHDLYNSTDGENWNWKGDTIIFGNAWNFSIPHANPCADRWQGITCDNSIFEINAIRLDRYGLHGSIPASFGNITTLVELNMTANKITGSIPPEMGQLTILQILELSNNHMIGSIPSTLGNCKQLIYLRLSINRIVGTLPASLGQLHNLQYIGIEFTKVGGIIPESFGNLSSLQTMLMANNMLSGPIPNTITGLTHLATMSLYGNKLNGTVPEFIGNMSSLMNIFLALNRLSGTLPESLGQLKYLQILDISQNGNLTSSGITGSIPSQLFDNCASLEALILGNNRLTGTIPVTIANCSQLSQLGLNNNDLLGTLPVELSVLTSLSELDLATNMFTGPIPPSYGDLSQLITLSLENNELTGSIPSDFSRLVSIKKLLLYNNRFNGSIPESLYTLGDMTAFDINQNYITGSISAALSQWTKLNILNLGNNQLTGEIPSEIGLFLNTITSIVLNDNYLHGTLPSTLGNITLLGTLKLNNNMFTGEIPSTFGLIDGLNGLFLDSNQLSGTIPAALGGLSILSSISLQHNALTGSIPGALTECKTLNQVLVFFNYLTGTFPSFIDTSYVHNSSIPVPEDNVIMQYIDYNNNYITGTIPDDLNKMIALVEFACNNNLLTGTVPPTMGYPPLLGYISIGNNFLTGSLPSQLSNLRFLSELFVNGNSLSGSLSGFCNSTTQSELTNIDVSNNQFTGQIPTEPFLIPGFQSFAAVSNCLTGSIPVDICNASALTSLALDGLASATSCQYKFISGVGFLPPTYGLRHSIHQGVPKCMFAMQNLRTLHLSGNGITGSIASGIVLGPNLNDLSLSYNVIGGSIPSAIQHRQWDNLDLSFNRITGELLDSIAEPHNNSLLLKVNRLSGAIPSSLLQATNLSILAGNMFYCGYYNRNALPSGEADAKSYDCGSNTVNLAMSLCVIVLGLSAVLTVGLWLVLPRYGHSVPWVENFKALVTRSLLVFVPSHQRSVNDSLDKPETTVSQVETVPSAKSAAAVEDPSSSPGGWKTFSVDSSCSAAQLSNLERLALFAASLRRVVLGITLFIIFVMLPVYCWLSAYFNTYAYEYAWTMGAVYLSGFAPSFVIFVLSSVVLFVMIYQLNLVIHRRETDYSRSRAKSKQYSSSKINYRIVLRIVVLLLINAMVIALVNTGYIILTGNYNVAIVVAAQMCLALFKIGWNKETQRCLMKYSKAVQKAATATATTTAENGSPENKVDEDDDAEAELLFSRPSRSMQLMVCVELFNNIVIPCITTMIISPVCFNAIINAPNTVQSTYEYQSCATLATGTTYSVCTSFEPVTATTSYAPPFNYSYQCSSILVENYASVYIFMFMIRIFGMHLPFVVLLQFYERFRHKSERLNQFILWFLPKLMWPLDRLEPLNRKTVFSRELFVLRVTSNLALFLTFGVMFPPIAAVACLAVFSHTYGTQLMLGRFITMTEDKGLMKYRSIVENDCKDISLLFWRSFYPVFPLSSVFYSFFIYDAYGDVVGWRKALWLVFLTICMPLIIRVALFVYDKYLRRDGSGGGGDDDRERLVSVNDLRKDSEKTSVENSHSKRGSGVGGDGVNGVNYSKRRSEVELTDRMSHMSSGMRGTDSNGSRVFSGDTSWLNRVMSPSLWKVWKSDSCDGASNSGCSAAFTVEEVGEIERGGAADVQNPVHSIDLQDVKEEKSKDMESSRNSV